MKPIGIVVGLFGPLLILYSVLMFLPVVPELQTYGLGGMPDDVAAIARPLTARAAGSLVIGVALLYWTVRRQPPSPDTREGEQGDLDGD